MLMPRLVDSHVHFWDPESRHHDWLIGEPRLHRRFAPEDLATGRYELAGMVFVQADCRDEEALDEVSWVCELAATDRRIQGIVAYAPVQYGAAAKETLQELAAHPRVVGVRRLLHGLAAESLLDRQLVAGVRLLSELELTFDVCVSHDQLKAVASLAKACPETSLVLDHLGKPPVAQGQLDPWRADIERIAAMPNVSCKLSGLTTEAAPAWVPDDLRPYLQHALAAFGPTRCMFGSDWPVASIRTSYERWVDVVAATIAGCSPVDRAAVLGGTAASFYRLPELVLAVQGGDDARSTVCR